MLSLRRYSLALWQALRSVIGLDELWFTLGLIVLTSALWPLAVRWCGAGQVALLPAGLVILWLALPTRASFIAPEPFEKRRKS